MSASREPVSNWGLYPKTESRVFHPETVADVQALMQEHARNAQANLADAMQNHHALQRLPGAGLIRRRVAR